MDESDAMIWDLAEQLQGHLMDSSTGGRLPTVEELIQAARDRVRSNRNLT